MRKYNFFMIVRKRWLLFLVCLAIVIAGVLYILLSWITRKNFNDLEIADVRRMNSRVESIFQHLASTVQSQTGDWAHWDAPWEMMVDTQAAALAFEKENLTSDALATIGVNLICFFDNSRNVRLAKGVSLSEAQDDPEALSKCGEIGKVDQFFDLEFPDSYGSGFVKISGGKIMMAVSSNIIRSDGSGPSRGYVVFASFLDDRMLAEVVNLSLFPVQLALHGSRDLPDDFKRAEVELGRGAREFIYAKDAGVIYGYICLRDVANMPLVMLRSEKSRDIFAQGERVVRSFAWISFAIGLLILWMVFLVSKVLEASKVKEDFTKVKSRSKELEEMNKLLVGRELRMVELKKQAQKMKREMARFKKHQNPDKQSSE